MIVLGIESCGDNCSVALAEENRLIGEININLKKSHSIILAPMVHDILKYANLELKDLDAISVDVGPGSFTGLRIGISLAASLAYGKDLPVVRVSSLEALYDIGSKFNDVEIIPMIFARKNEAYVLYKGISMVVNIEEFLGNLKKDKKYLFIGDGAIHFKELIMESGCDFLEIDESYNYVLGETIAFLGVSGMKEGKGISPLLVEPVYLKKPEAEINLEMKMRANDNC